MLPEFKNTLKLFRECNACIGIIGLGYVGIPLAEAIYKKGFHVIGMDVDQHKTELLNEGKSYLHHFSDNRIKAMLDSGHFETSTDFSRAGECDALILCVPTPLGKHHEPVIDFIENAANEITPYLTKGQLVVLESSTFPGTTNEILRQALESNGLKAGEDFCIAFSPEREDPGNLDYTTDTIPKLVAGAGDDAQELATALYSQFIGQIIPLSRPEVAEAAKLLENIFRELNIGLVNELKMIFDAMNIDIWEVIDAAKTKPFGYMPFYPGPGVGGHCIPLDPFYLTWKAQEIDMPTRFINLAGEINEHMPHYVVDKTSRALSDHFKKALNGAKILLAGVAYKKNIDDFRESPALKVAELLRRRGSLVSYYDPLIPRLPGDAVNGGALAGRNSIDFSAEKLAGFDAVIVTTDHDIVDYHMFSENCALVIDTRNTMKRCTNNKCIIVAA